MVIPLYIMCGFLMFLLQQHFEIAFGVMGWPDLLISCFDKFMGFFVLFGYGTFVCASRHICLHAIPKRFMNAYRFLNLYP